MFRVADVGTSKNPRGTYTKKDKEDMMPKTAFFSKLERVGDTNIGTTNMIQLINRLKEGQSSMAKKIYKSGIVHVHECYPQLHLHNTKDFKMFYGAFAMKIVRVQ